MALRREAALKGCATSHSARHLKHPRKTPEAIRVIRVRRVFFFVCFVIFVVPTLKKTRHEDTKKPFHECCGTFFVAVANTTRHEPYAQRA
jgi:hypothetical protein